MRREKRGVKIPNDTSNSLTVKYFYSCASLGKRAAPLVVLLPATGGTSRVSHLVVAAVPS